MSFIKELKRRNVFRVGIAYAIATWVLLQMTEVIAPILSLPDWAPKLIFVIFAVGFIPALIFAWAFELTPEGIKKEKDVDREESITDDPRFIAVEATMIDNMNIQRQALGLEPIDPPSQL